MWVQRKSLSDKTCQLTLSPTTSCYGNSKNFRKNKSTITDYFRLGILRISEKIDVVSQTLSTGTLRVFEMNRMGILKDSRVVSQDVIVRHLQMTNWPRHKAYTINRSPLKHKTLEHKRPLWSLFYYQSNNLSHSERRKYKRDLKRNIVKKFE